MANKCKVSPQYILLNEDKSLSRLSYTAFRVYGATGVETRGEGGKGVTKELLINY